MLPLTAVNIYLVTGTHLHWFYTQVSTVVPLINDSTRELYDCCWCYMYYCLFYWCWSVWCMVFEAFVLDWGNSFRFWLDNRHSAWKQICKHVHAAKEKVYKRLSPQMLDSEAPEANWNKRNKDKDVIWGYCMHNEGVQFWTKMVYGKIRGSASGCGPFIPPLHLLSNPRGYVVHKR